MKKNRTSASRTDAAPASFTVPPACSTAFSVAAAPQLGNVASAVSASVRLRVICQWTWMWSVLNV